MEEVAARQKREIEQRAVELGRARGIEHPQRRHARVGCCIVRSGAVIVTQQDGKCPAGREERVRRQARRVEHVESSAGRNAGGALLNTLF